MTMITRANFEKFENIVKNVEILDEIFTTLSDDKPLNKNSLLTPRMLKNHIKKQIEKYKDAYQKALPVEEHIINTLSAYSKLEKATANKNSYVLDSAQIYARLLMEAKKRNANSLNPSRKKNIKIDECPVENFTDFTLETDSYIAAKSNLESKKIVEKRCKEKNENKPEGFGTKTKNTFLKENVAEAKAKVARIINENIDRENKNKILKQHESIQKKQAALENEINKLKEKKQEQIATINQKPSGRTIKGIKDLQKYFAISRQKKELEKVEDKLQKLEKELDILLSKIYDGDAKIDSRGSIDLEKKLNEVTYELYDRDLTRKYASFDVMKDDPQDKNPSREARKSTRTITSFSKS